MLENLRVYLSWAIIGFLMISICLYVWKQGLMLMQRPWSFRHLFRDFRAKMWMTLGLGIVFFSLYGMVVLGSSYLIDSEVGGQLFSLARQTPHYFIYAGLLTFAIFSLSIYLVRMVIKYLYLTRKM